MMLQDNGPDVVRIDVIVQSFFAFFEEFVEFLLTFGTCGDETEAGAALET